MALLNILKIPDARLRLKTQSVSTIDDEVKGLLQSMLETLRAQDALGLAANQVGILKRLIVIDLGPEVHPQPLQIINPEITWKSKEMAEFEEGCLSIPDVYIKVKRPQAVRVKYLDPLNQPQEISAEGLLADCLQHEIEHLDGILSIDHLTPLKRQLVLRKVEKYLKQQSRTAVSHAESA